MQLLLNQNVSRDFRLQGINKAIRNQDLAHDMETSHMQDCLKRVKTPTMTQIGEKSKFVEAS